MFTSMDCAFQGSFNMIEDHIVSFHTILIHIITFKETIACIFKVLLEKRWIEMFSGEVKK